MSKIEDSILGYTRNDDPSPTSTSKMLEIHNEWSIAKIETNFGYLIADFDGSDLIGMTVRFWGDTCNDESGSLMLMLYPPGRIIAPTKRKLTAEEYEFIKRSIIAYIEVNKTNRLKISKIMFAK